MAVQKKLIPSSEARKVINQLPSDDTSDAAGANGKMPRIRSSHVADLELALEDHAVSQVTDFAERLDDALMFDDFVDEADDGHGKVPRTG